MVTVHPVWRAWVRLGVPFVVQKGREDSWDQGHGVRRLVVQIHLTACIKPLTSAPGPNSTGPGEQPVSPPPDTPQTPTLVSQGQSQKVKMLSLVGLEARVRFTFLIKMLHTWP